MATTEVPPTCCSLGEEAKILARLSKLQSDQILGRSIGDITQRRKGAEAQRELQVIDDTNKAIN